MPEFTATVHWSRPSGEAEFVQQQYSRRHHWLFDGGAEVVGSSSPHSVPLPWSDPAAVDPEEAFVASLSSCHMLWFLSLAAKAGWVVDDYRDEPLGVMARNDAGRMEMTRVTLKPAVQFGSDRLPSSDEVMQLHERAHHHCYIANSVTTEIRIEPR